MPLTEFSRAERTIAVFKKQRDSNLAQKDGLRYEKKVGKELTRHLTAGRFTQIEHNPWFSFTHAEGDSKCAPDFLLHSGSIHSGSIIIVEVKLTWIELALEKINSLYTPVVELALGKKTTSLVICRNLTKTAPPAKYSIREALTSPHRLLHWSEIGNILW